MHPNSVFRWNDPAAMAEFVTTIGFGTLFAATADGPRVAHMPIVLEDGELRFHLARGNALTRHLDGMTALFVVNGPDAYVSPDWYALGANEVPTWNYLAVEIEGRVRKLSESDLLAQIDALGAIHEGRIADKAPWTRAKADPAHIAQLARGITGFALEPTVWRGTAKLSQNKPATARLAAADAIEAAGSRAIAHLMRNIEG